MAIGPQIHFYALGAHTPTAQHSSISRFCYLFVKDRKIFLSLRLFAISIWPACEQNVRDCVITPRGFTSLTTQEAEYSFSGFIPTNKQTNKQTVCRWRRSALAVWRHNNNNNKKAKRRKESQVLPGYLITAHYLCAFLLYLAR